jgi:hypothetical protein
MTFKNTIAAMAAASALAGGTADAAVIFSNFGPNYDFNRIGQPFHIHDADPLIVPGMVFSSAVDADVSEITIALTNFTGDNNAVVSIWSKDLTTQLGSWSIGIPNYGPTAKATKITGITGVHLNAGAEYVLFAAGPGNSYNYWQPNRTGDQGFSTTRKGSTYLSGRTRGAFEILSAAPEPSTWALMIIGFGGAGAMVRRRRSLATA